ncbi:TetR/AcrR family transcriptional regulator [Mycobacterium sp. SMC-4]|uniref:TetR/AcrR family transcriptional regulator n=1 Tax=Mycobacterium sp. SMC-4 TaxID=2857059 RepID=UPI003D045C10
MATLRETQKQQTRRLLLDTGLALVNEKGYTATTIDDIAAAAGTTRTTFYLHFKSKAALIKELLAEADAVLTGDDDPPLAEVVRSGDRMIISRWLDHKISQWSRVGPYLLAAHQAEASEAEVAATIASWFDGTIAAIRRGLDDAGRFEPESRWVRSALAFGQFEFMSRRWFTRGWEADREVCLRTLTDSWCHLLTQD